MSISGNQSRAAAANDISIAKDVPFLGDGRSEKMDLYLPGTHDRETKLPVVLQIHGGGWHQGDKATPREKNIATNLAKAGFACASINYRLAQHRERFPDRLSQVWPGNLHDCMTGVRFLRANAGEYNLDPARIAALGTSAGGQLAALLGSAKEGGVLDHKEGPHGEHSWRVQAVVPLYGVHDCFAHSKTRGLDLSPREKELCRQASPVTHLSESAPPFLIVHGTEDAIVPSSQSRSLKRAAATVGLESRLHLVKGARHGFHMEPEEKDLRPLIIDFLRKHLR